MELITEKELTTLLAEKVMGWVLDDDGWWCVRVKEEDMKAVEYCFDFNPLDNANHALQVLEAFLDSSSQIEYHVFTHDCARPIVYDVTLYDSFDDTEFQSINKSLNHAICLAVAEAVTGVKYELKGEQNDDKPINRI